MTTKTKAPVPAPARTGRASFLGSLPQAPTFVPENMPEPTTLKDLNFKVDPAFHKEFKQTATAFDLSMRDLLMQSFEAWKNTNGAKAK